jgi:hypothetical protein
MIVYRGKTASIYEHYSGEYMKNPQNSRQK